MKKRYSKLKLLLIPICIIVFYFGWSFYYIGTCNNVYKCANNTVSIGKLERW
jgi:hypothetical protein